MADICAVMAACIVKAFCVAAQLAAFAAAIREVLLAAIKLICIEFSAAWFIIPRVDTGIKISI
jgi:hypothetical protein